MEVDEVMTTVVVLVHLEMFQTKKRKALESYIIDGK